MNNKWIYDREKIIEIFKQKNFEIPDEIKEISSEARRNKLIEIHKFLEVNFSDKLKTGISAKVVRNALYEFASHIYFNEMDEVKNILEYLARLKILTLYPEEVKEIFVKK